MQKRNFTVYGVLLAGVVFLAVNLIATKGLRSWRVDLTEEKLYTLSEGSLEIASHIDEPIHLYLYVSEDVAKQIPDVSSYVKRVRELLEEFALRSDGTVELEVIDTEPFSEAEDRAQSEGLRAVPVSSGDVLYFGLVGTNATDDRELIPFFKFNDPEAERFLEYDVSKLVYTLAHPEKRVVGLISALALEGSRGNPMMGAEGSPPWQVLAQMQDLYDVRVLGTEVESIPDEVDVLALIHPKDLGEGTLYAIDQFALAGGKIVAFVDPHCQLDPAGGDPMRGGDPSASKASNPERLFRAWGFELVPNKIVGDREHAVQGNVGSEGRPELVSLLPVFELGHDSFDGEDAVTSLLESVKFYIPGVLQPLPDAKTTFTTLARTSEDSMQIDVGAVQFYPDWKTLAERFVPEKKALAVAARIAGEVDSAFPDGKPAAAEPDPEVGELAAPEAPAPHLAHSTAPLNLVVVADVDLLYDALWLEEQRLGPYSLGWIKTADNGDLLMNAVENLAGGDALISIRAQGRYSRPFTRVEEIRKDAEQRFLSEQQDLERKLQDLERTLADMQKQQGTDTEFIWSPEQEKALIEAKNERIATRKRLREVQHGLLKDVERLGTELKVANILLVPLLVATLAIALGVYRVRRRTTN